MNQSNIEAKDKILHTTIREYVEKMPVEIIRRNGRLVIKAYNEAGHNITLVDLADVIDWVTNKLVFHSL